MRDAIRTFFIGALGLLAGCATAEPELSMGLAPGAPAVVAEGSADDSDVPYEDNPSFAGRATYACDDGQTLVVANQTTSISIDFADGSSLTMPASPEDSRTRYVADQQAFVLDGEEALLFRPKRSPATCRRESPGNAA